MNIKLYLQEKKKFIEEWLEQHLPEEDISPSSIYQAMHYSLSAKSKRIRPILLLAVTESLGGEIKWALPFACALELIHTYSLIHDDLPSMDNDDFRRGKPSNHKVFGEGMAILTGDALLTHAFFMMTSPETTSSIPSGIVLQNIHEISKAAGFSGMIGGQVMDLAFEGKSVFLPQIEEMHNRKTGAMIAVAVRVGGLLAEASEEQMEKLDQYGKHIGLAFQIIDDLLDIEGQPELLGKATGKDFSSQKATFPSILGLEKSKKYAENQYKSAIQSIEGFGKQAEILRALAKFIIFREF